jgi:hypothetical protein
MSKYLWLVLLAVPPWVAEKLDAPKWVLLLAAAPFFFRAATLGDDPDEHLLGEGFARFRRPVLLMLLVGGFVFGTVMLIVFRAASDR